MLQGCTEDELLSFPPPLQLPPPTDQVDRRPREAKRILEVHQSPGAGLMRNSPGIQLYCYMDILPEADQPMG